MECKETKKIRNPSLHPSCGFSLPHHHIQNHHQYKADGETFIKKTNAAPNIVPNNGINNPTVIPMTIYLFAKVKKTAT